MARRLLSGLFFAVLIITAMPAYADDRPGNPAWYDNDLYTVETISGGEKVITSNGSRLTTLADYRRYTSNGRPRLRLVSRLGFIFENIFLDNTYFYNEAIATFLEGEELLPQAKTWLEDNGYNSRSLRGLRFRFPDSPYVNQTDGYTYMRWQGMIILGLTYNVGGSIAETTYGYNRYGVICHEYAHMCGYSHGDDSASAHGGPFRVGRRSLYPYRRIE